MKILLLSPIATPEIAKLCLLPVHPSGGWIEGLISELCKYSSIDLYFCFDTGLKKTLVKGNHRNIKYIGFSDGKTNILLFKNLISNIKPDIVHIFGTEKTFSYDMVCACEEVGLINRTIINIQGLTSVITKHYYAFLPYNIIYGWSLRDILKHNNIYYENKIFEKRGNKEIAAIKKAKHVIGRTDWDYACINRINSKVNYHFNNESLRTIFYEKQWKIEECEKYSIFVSQYSYPLKGFHIMLEAMVDILRDYPDAHLYVTGENPVLQSWVESLRLTKYNQYIKKILIDNDLEKNVTFCGKLDSKQMCERFLRSNVFINCSSIENSSNSIGEAMLLGLPVVASDVGGIKSFLMHEKEGFLYQSDAPYMLAYCIKKIFSNDQLAVLLSTNARLRALKTYDKSKNVNELIKIYSELLIR